jgi:hypothetical protein
MDKIIIKEIKKVKWKEKEEKRTSRYCFNVDQKNG